MLQGVLFLIGHIWVLGLHICIIYITDSILTFRLAPHPYTGAPRGGLQGGSLTWGSDWSHYHREYSDISHWWLGAITERLGAITEGFWNHNREVRSYNRSLGAIPEGLGTITERLGAITEF